MPTPQQVLWVAVKGNLIHIHHSVLQVSLLTGSYANTVAILTTVILEIAIVPHVFDS